MVAWYRRDQWPRLLELADDRDTLPPTYDQWQVSVDRGLEELRETGVQPLPIEVDVEQLKVWCEERESPLNSATRAAYAADLARSRSQGDG